METKAPAGGGLLRSPRTNEYLSFAVSKAANSSHLQFPIGSATDDCLIEIIGSKSRYGAVMLALAKSVGPLSTSSTGRGLCLRGLRLGGKALPMKPRLQIEHVYAPGGRSYESKCSAGSDRHALNPLASAS